MAYDEGLAERIWDEVRDDMSIADKKMFGGLCFLLNDYMFIGIVKDELMVRVGPEKYESALSEPHVRKMDFTGRPMKGYVYVETAGFESDADLKKWIDRGAEFVKTLPPKKKK